MENFQNDLLQDDGIKIDNDTRFYLQLAAKWAKFLSITIFVIFGLFLLIIIPAAVAYYFMDLKKVGIPESVLPYNMNFMFGIGMFVIIITFAILFLIYSFLYKFAKRTNFAIINDDENELNRGIDALKTYTIIMVVFAGIGILASIAKLVV